MKEALILKRAREARLSGERKFDVRLFANLAGTLAIRSIKRADVIHSAMLARGFNGDIPDVRKSDKAGGSDIVFLVLSIF